MLNMAVRKLLLVAILQLFVFNCTMGEWNPKSPLILVDLLPPNSHGKVFPYVVRQSNQRVVYHSPDYENDSIIYPFCGDLASRYPYSTCNYADEPFFSSQYTIPGHPRPKEKCNDKAEYDIIRSLDNTSRRNHETCHFNGISGRNYEFIYRESAMEKVMIYKACYRNNEKQTMFASYTIQAPYLLNSIFLADERDHQFQLDLRHFHNDFTRTTLESLNYIYRQNPQFTPMPILPPELLPFAHQRRPLFHFMNMAAMETSLVSGWQALMTNLRDKLSVFQYAINVTAGLLDVMKDDRGNTIYLRSYGITFGIPISKTWWILFYNVDKTQGVVIMIDNSPISLSEQIYYDMDRCDLLTICGQANLIDALLPLSETLNIYCCVPSVITGKLNLDGGDTILRFPNV